MKRLLLLTLFMGVAFAGFSQTCPLTAKSNNGGNGCDSRLTLTFSEPPTSAFKIDSIVIEGETYGRRPDTIPRGSISGNTIDYCLAFGNLNNSQANWFIYSTTSNGTKCVTVACNGNNCNVLPIKFKSINYVRLSRTEVKVTFDVAEATGINVYKVKVSFDGVNFVDRAVLFPSSIKNGIYSVTLKL